MKDVTVQNLQELLKVPGIYYIEINNKGYVGSSSSIGHRLKHHLWALKSGKHHNRTMQNTWNKHQVIAFKVLELCDHDTLIEKEKFFIDTLKPYMNHIINPQNIERDEIYRKRISDGLKKAYAKGLEIHNKQEVHMYNLEGDYIKTFTSITEAGEFFNTEPSGICAVLNGRAYSAKGHLWSTEKKDQVLIPKKNYQVVSVQQLDLNQVLVKVWASVKEAETTLRISNIHRAASNNRTAGGFKWKFV